MADGQPSLMLRVEVCYRYFSESTAVKIYKSCYIKIFLLLLSCGVFFIVENMKIRDITHSINRRKVVLPDTKSVCNMSKVIFSTQTSLMAGTRMPLINPPSNISVPKSANHSMCVFFKGRLGNNIFQFASSFGTAAGKGMSIMISNRSLLHKTFNINVQIKSEKFLQDNCITRNEHFKCRYDENLIKFDNNKNYAIRQNLQSWKYFYNASVALREQLRFTKAIDVMKGERIKTVLEKHNMRSRSSTTLIGVHVRRGDFLDRQKDGYAVASAGYLRKAVNYFLSKRLPNTLFLAFSNGMNWTKRNMPSDIKVEYMTGNSPELDLAILASCDHVITTVGTFSWWAGWLAGGEVTFFQWPAIEGTGYLRLHYSADYSDFFYPGWIGFT